MSAADVVCLWLGRVWSLLILTVLASALILLARDRVRDLLARRREVRLARSRPVPCRLAESVEWQAFEDDYARGVR